MTDSNKIGRKKGGEKKVDNRKLDRPGKPKRCQSPLSDCFQSLGGIDRFVSYGSVSVCIYRGKILSVPSLEDKWHVLCCSNNKSPNYRCVPKVQEPQYSVRSQ